jgi:hypothetical protein
MKKNVSKTDAVVRSIIAIIIALLFYQRIITGAVGIALLVISGVFLLTSIFKVCPLYSIIGFSSCPYEDEEE